MSKKPYVKPTITIEHFQLNRHLCSCATEANLASPGVCGYADEYYEYKDGSGHWVPTTVFADTGVCDTYRPGGSWQDDGKTICINTFSNPLFSS